MYSVTLSHIHQLEVLLQSSHKIERWNENEIQSCLNELKVGLREGNVPKYSLKMLLSYSKENPLISGLTKKISDSIAR